MLIYGNTCYTRNKHNFLHKDYLVFVSKEILNINNQLNTWYEGIDFKSCMQKDRIYSILITF